MLNSDYAKTQGISYIDLNSTNDIIEIIYLPTLRCNCRCLHCGIRFDDFNDEEMSCKEVAQVICESECIAPNAVFMITGGEPFLKDDIKDFVLAILHRFTSCSVSITTNGTLPSKMQCFLNDIPKQYAERISFAISIDGLEQTHNSIRRHDDAFNLALQSIKIIAEHGFKFSINTVIYSQYFSELNIMKHRLLSLTGVDCNINFIPIFTDVALTNDEFPYSDDEIKNIFPLVKDNKLHMKYICSKGNITAEENCHAGDSNIVLLPSGEVYTCKVASAYKKDAKKYLMGSLNNENVTLDDIWAQRINSDALESVKNCRRCNNPCDIDRENLYYGLSYKLVDSDITQYFNISDENIYYGDGWHDPEFDNERTYRWMANHEAIVYISNLSRNRKNLNIKYFNSMPNTNKEPMLLDIFVNGVSCLSKYPVSESEELNIPIKKIVKKDKLITVKFVASHIWRPCDVSDSDDERNLGIALHTIMIQ